MLVHPIAALLALLMLLATRPAGAADAILSARCIGCNMRDQDLHGRDLHGGTYIGTDMHNINLRGADLHDVRFVGVDLSGGHLDGSDLRGTTFTGVDFGDATLSGARVTGIRLTGVEFSRADLHGLDLHGTTLVGSDFDHANLENVNFNGAALCNGHAAKPCANLRGARVAGADFRNVRWCEEFDRGCRPVTADELRRLGSNPLTGAQLP
jgi:uncharacterized protein YjbI with pentapeptide repeats